MLKLHLLGILVLLSAFVCGPSFSKEVSSARKAEALFKAKCQACHSTGSVGGCLGPILQGERSRRSKEFIETRISNDPGKADQFARLYGHAELMPHMRVSPSNAKLLTEYIYSLETPKGGYSVKGHVKKAQRKVAALGASQPDMSNEGKRLVYEKGCLMCHSLGNIGGQFAPAFDGIGRRREIESITQSISNAELLIGNSGKEYGARGAVMPGSDLSNKDIEAIAAFLISLK